jgi:hypothetical protein
MSNTKTTQKQMGNDPVLGRLGKKEIIKKLVDRHPEVSKKQLEGLDLKKLKALLMSWKPLTRTGPMSDVHPGTDKRGGRTVVDRIKEHIKGTKVAKRRGGGIAKRGFGIAK